MVEKTCPKCGLKYSYIDYKKVGNRVYAYAVHVEHGKRKRCYLGARDGYVHVSVTHADIGLKLKGLSSEDRVLEYLETLLDYVKDNMVDDAKRFRVISLLKEALEVLEGEPEVFF
jgi:hypothetical protein